MIRALFMCSVLVAAIACAANAQPAHAQSQPNAEPILRIDAGMHTAIIRRIGVNATCTLLATSSEDKSVRLWRVPEGNLLKTLRPPIGAGNNGKLYAVGLAPNGTWLAAGGWNRTGADHWVFIFDTSSGAILTRLGPFQVIDHIAVSTDGQTLVAALRNGQGIRAWQMQGGDPRRWKLVLEDKGYFGSDVKSAAFDGHGNLFTVAHDRRLRRYASKLGGPPLAVSIQGGRLPSSVAVTGSGERLAVSFSDTPAIEIYDAVALTRLYAADTSRFRTGTFATVAWSASGDRLYAGGTLVRDKQFVIGEWNASGEMAREHDGSADAILNLVPCGDGVAVAAGDPAFGIIDRDGTRRHWQGRVSADFRGSVGEHFLVSPDALRVRFGLGDGQPPVLFDLAASQLTASPVASADLAPARIGGLPVAMWQNSPTPSFFGHRIKLEKGERAQSLAVTADKQQFVLGTDYYLRSYDKDGQFLWKKQATGAIWGVNIARDRNVVVAAVGDGTLRWHRLDNGEELLSLFVHAQDRRWVAWTPSGYYMASANGENLIGWQVNRGWTTAADFFPVSRFRELRYRPDIVTRILADLSEPAAVKGADAFLNRKSAAAPIENLLPPIVSITSPPNYSQVSSSNVVVAYKVRSPSGLRIKRLYVQLDGRPVTGAVVTDVPLNSSNESTGALTVTLPKGDAALSLVAETDETTPRLGVADTVNLLRVGLSTETVTVQPRLFALIVGVGHYKSGTLELGTFPANDAEDLAAQLKSQEGKDLAFEQVALKVLTDQQATRKHIEDGLQWLVDNVQVREDIALFYFSGHGMTTSGTSSYILPVEYDSKRITSALSKSTIVDTLRTIPGRVVILVDACYAADGLELSSTPGVRRLEAAGLITELADYGMISFASSSGRERSYALGRNSYFTKALIEGLKGLARVHPSDNMIFTDGLSIWLGRRVNGLSEGRQTPVMSISPFARPLPLAVLR